MTTWINEAAAICLNLVSDAGIRLLPIAILTFVLMQFLRRQSASVRHHVWLTLIASSLILPLIAWVLPALPILPQFDLKTSAQSEIRLSGQQPHRPIQRLSSFPESPRRKATPGDAIQPDILGAQTQTLGNLPAAQSNEPLRAETSWTTYAVSVWILIAGAIAAIPILGQQRLRRRFAHATVADGDVLQIHETLRQEMGIRRRVALRITGDDLMPMTWGVLRPVVLLPSDSTTWTRSRLRMVLLHELAHVRRFDCLSQWLSTCATALYWFHPAVWYAARRLHIEREFACDNAVLQGGYSGSHYATELLDIGTGCQRDVVAMCAGIAISRRGRLSDRVHAAVDTNMPRGTISPRMILFTGTLFFGLVAFVASISTTSAQAPTEPAVATDATRPSPQRASSSTETSHGKSNQDATVGFRLPDGTQIDLIGLGGDPAEAKPRWWRPDGAATTEALLTAFEGIHNPRTGGIAFKQLAVRVTATQDVRRSQAAKLFVVSPFNPANEGIRWRAPFQRGRQSSMSSFRGYMASYAVTQETATISLAVATGENRRIWRLPPLNLEGPSTTTQIKPTKQTVVSGPANQTDSAIMIPIVHSFTEHDVEVFARLANGKLVEADRLADTGSAAFTHSTATFRSLRLEDIEQLELHIRPLVRFEIRNVSLRPGVLTRPKIYGPWVPEKGEIPMEGGGMTYRDPARQLALKQRYEGETKSQQTERLQTFLQSAPAELTDIQKDALAILAKYETEVSFEKGADGKPLAQVMIEIHPGDDDAAVGALAALGEVQFLQLSGDGLSDLHFAPLRDVTRLQGLEVFDSDQVTGHIADSIKHIPNLEFVRVTSPNFDDNDLALLSSVTSIESLDLDGTGVKAGLHVLDRLPNLKHIDLSCTEIRGTCFDALNETRALTHIVLDDTDLTDDAIATLKRFPQLELIHIRGTSNVTASGVLQLLSLPNLSGLSLSDWHLSDQVLDTIASKPRISHLWLDGASVTDATLAKLSHLNLEDLIITGARLTDAGVSHVSGMTKLKRLGLEDCRIGDDALRSIDQLTNLELLDIAGTDVTDDGLTHLSKLKSLGYVNATRTRVSKTGADKLKAIQPQLTVAHDRIRR